MFAGRLSHRLKVLMVANEGPTHGPGFPSLRVEFISYVMYKFVFGTCRLQYSEVLVQSSLQQELNGKVSRHQAVVGGQVLGGLVSAISQHEPVIRRAPNDLSVVKGQFKEL